MTVKDIMQKDVATCSPDADAATAGQTMRNHKCGFLPVVDGHGIVVGVVTDRDLCLALVNTDRAAEHVAVKVAMSSRVFSCFPDENLKVVLATMGNHQVRRLPVLDKHGHLQGVVSVDDIVQADRRRGAPTAEETVDALRRIGGQRPIEIAVA